MDKINERIKTVVSESRLTKTAFAKRLNVTQAYVSALCLGKKTPSDRTIVDICREFNVSETWLRTGEGEMFIQKKPQPLEELLSDLLGGEAVTDEDKILFKNFLELPDASRKVVIEFVQKCAVELSAPSPVVVSKNETTTPVKLDAGKDTPVPARQEWTGPDIAAKVAELERQNQEKDKQLQELAAKVAAMEEEERDEQLAADFGATFSALQSGFAGNVDPGKRTKK